MRTVCCSILLIFPLTVAVESAAGDGEPDSALKGRVSLADGLLPLPLPDPPTMNGVPADADASADATGSSEDVLPPLEQELMQHGGSYLYEAIDASGAAAVTHGHGHPQFLSLPETWQKPLPLMTAFQEFEGADQIRPWHGLKWAGENGFQWEPRLVVHGSYEIFGQLLEAGGTRQDGVGHQLILDMDLRITGTERAHVQFRPLGRRGTGGSFFQISDPSGYHDNSTLIPDRWWIEGEVYSLFSDWIDDAFTPWDYHVTLGKVPYSVHNSLLINDEVTGVIVTKNTLIVPPFSNLLIQGFHFIDDVDTATPFSTDFTGLHAAADWRHAYLEATLAYVSHSRSSDFDARYAAFSATQFFGPVTVAGRALFKGGDDAGTGDGALYVLESNLTRAASHEFECATGIQKAVVYANLFKSTSGWSPVSGANFNRLRSTFAVDPLIRIGRGFNPSDTLGASLGVELFRHHEDEQFIPELAYEQIQGEPVWAVGLRWLRKIGPRCYLDASGVLSWSDDRSLEREGVFVSTFVVF